jgi:hypothetical protein
MVDAAANNRTPNFRSTSPSTDDARYVAGNRARQEAERARNASNPSFGDFLKGLLGGKDPRARDRSTFRNPGPSQGILGEPGLFSGGSKLGVSDFVPFGGLLNYMTRRPVDSGATYTMNTQSGTGAGVGGQQALANMQSRRLAANQRAEAAYSGRNPQTALAPPPPPASPARSLRPQLRPSQAAGVPSGMEAQYSTSPAPLLADPDIQLEAFTGQPSDPMYRPSGEFDAFVEMTMDFPDFDDIRDNRDLMMDVFKKYKAMHRGAN